MVQIYVENLLHTTRLIGMYMAKTQISDLHLKYLWLFAVPVNVSSLYVSDIMVHCVRCQIKRETNTGVHNFKRHERDHIQ